jgi:general secretion pathway protein K
MTPSNSDAPASASVHSAVLPGWILLYFEVLTSYVRRQYKSSPGRSKGGALLAVLWLSAALAAIAFSAAQTVRAERERTHNQLEGTQASLLASSAAERGLLYVFWGPSARLPDGRPRFWTRGTPFVRMSFPSGEALVEIIPESSKIDVNRAQPELIARLLSVLGVAPAASGRIAALIVQWRSPLTAEAGLDALYEQVNPTFRPPHASFQQIEELLSVPGITPELFYGRVGRSSDGSWATRVGLRDCLSVYSGSEGDDINSVQPAVMAAVGVPPQGIAAVVSLRRQRPIVAEQMVALAPVLGEAANRFRPGGGRILTIRATARVRLPNAGLSELRRTATLTVLIGPGYDASGYRILDSRSGPAVRPLEETWPW